jgi:hypothetical protein
MSSPVWITPAGFLGTLSERRTISIPVVATTTGTNLSYSIISGQLPTGVYLNTSTGLLLGTPVSVALDTETTFVIRAKDSIGISDRTFSFTTTGVDEPVWVTTPGLLPVGRNGEMYAINKQYIDYKVRAETDILLSGNNLKYFIADNQGQLPPGVTLSQDGYIRGYVNDNLILDDQASANGGYDTEAYDLYPFEHNASNENEYNPSNVLGRLDISDITLSDPGVVYTDGFHNFVDGRLVYIEGLTNPIELKGNGYYVKVYSANSFALYSDQELTLPVDTSALSVYSKDGQVAWGTASLGKPQVINKTYQFTVTVTDGITSARRTFNIDVVDRNSLRVDNTFLSVDSDWFDSSAGYLLAPIWQSKYGDKLPNVSNLGTVRAGREQILNVYDYDPYPLDGPTVFTWSTLTVNPDIKLVADSRVGLGNLPTRNLQGQNAIYFKDAEIIPVKGMQIRLGEYLPGGDNITYTITGVIKLTDSTGILNIDQPLAQLIPDSRIFYVGTQSRRPTGLALDPLNGNIYGKLSYQPSYSDSYRFTVQVVKINQASGDISLNDASGGTARIVGRQYLEGLTVSTTATMSGGFVDNLIPDIAVQLPDPVDYADTGLVGDIILVGISDNVEYNDLLGVMGGTTYAFIYTNPDNNPAWEYLGETVISNQIYLLTVLGEIPSAIQWVSTSSLGSISAGQISELVVKAVNTNTNYSITYELISGQLPQGLTLDYDGTIKGKITNTGQTYFDFGITTASFIGSISNSVLNVNTVTSGNIVAHQYITSTSTNPGLVADTFIISGNGNTWTVSNHTTSTTFDIVTTSTGTLLVGTITEVVILSTTTSITTSSIDLSTTTFNATTLSPNAFSNGLLSIDNNLSTIDQNWHFTIRASDAYRLSAVEKEFFITVNADSLSDYTRIYVKPFMLREKRNAYRDFITDSLIFDPVLIYRPNDPEFGVQPQIKMLIETGIEQVDLDLYAEAMQQYFYKKRFFFGEVKSILAQDQNGTDVYEIIYVEIIDDQMSGNNAVGISVANMQRQLEAIEIDSDTILVDERLQPKYMTTLNADTGVPLGFIKAVPICYTIPGGSVKILSRINNAINTGAFNFNRFDFDTDRIVIETVKETQQTGWLAYPTERR